MNFMKKIGRAVKNTFKGKNKVGKAIDGVLELAPIPNPIRFFREDDIKKKLKLLSESPKVRREAFRAGVDVDELIAEQPGWFVPVMSVLAFTGFVLLAWTGVIDGQTAGRILQGIISILIGG